MKQSLAAFLAQLRRMFAKETLPAPPSEGPPRRAGPRIAQLLAAEPLPQDAAPGGPERRGLLRAFFGPEPLALDAPAAPHRRSRWLAWLFAPERLDGG